MSSPLESLIHSIRILNPLFLNRFDFCALHQSWIYQPCAFQHNLNPLSRKALSIPPELNPPFRAAVCIPSQFEATLPKNCIHSTGSWTHPFEQPFAFQHNLNPYSWKACPFHRSWTNPFEQPFAFQHNLNPLSWKALSIPPELNQPFRTAFCIPTQIWIHSPQKTLSIPPQSKPNPHNIPNRSWHIPNLYQADICDFGLADMAQ